FGNSAAAGVIGGRLAFHRDSQNKIVMAKAEVKMVPHRNGSVDKGISMGTADVEAALGIDGDRGVGARAVAPIDGGTEAVGRCFRIGSFEGSDRPRECLSRG